MKDRFEDYEKATGWSSKRFAPNALPLLAELKVAGHSITVGRSVIHIAGTLKAYVHHNGRSAEYATITDMAGAELATFHYTDFASLASFIKSKLILT